MSIADASEGDATAATTPVMVLIMANRSLTLATVYGITAERQVLWVGVD